MKIRKFRLCGVRCFEDTGELTVDERCNVFVGKNNSGKSTALRSILALQGYAFDEQDIRPVSPNSFSMVVAIFPLGVDRTVGGSGIEAGEWRFSWPIRGARPYDDQLRTLELPLGQSPFLNVRPYHQIVPFLARRKTVSYEEDVSLASQSNVTGTYAKLNSRIDTLTGSGHPDSAQFAEKAARIIGVPVGTNASQNGKQAGYYFDRTKFITFDRMGDGVSDIAALLAELISERGKVFVIEEPETNLHPQALKEIMAAIRESSEHNQFFISTHSNIVVRELGGAGGGKIFRVFREGDERDSPSKIEEVERTPEAHTHLLRELGYEFTDFNLHDGWLFLEESTAERIIRDILIPEFVPKLHGRLRTYSAAGVTNLEPSIAEFQRLIVFIHLQPVYKGLLWIRADGDEAGRDAVSKIRSKFPRLEEDAVATFGKPQFENYYPEQFQEKVTEILAIADKSAKRQRKIELLNEVLEWSKNNPSDAKTAWAASAREPIELLCTILSQMNGSRDRMEAS